MRGLVVIDQCQPFEIGLANHKGQLVGAIGRIDRDQDHADSGSGKLE